MIDKNNDIDDEEDGEEEKNQTSKASKKKMLLIILRQLEPYKPHLQASKMLQYRLTFKA